MVRVVSTEERIVSISLRALIRASTSSSARGTTLPVTVGTRVRMVLLRLKAMPTKEDWMAGREDCESVVDSVDETMEARAEMLIVARV